MVKSLISILFAFLIVIGGALYENEFVDKTCREFKEKVEIVYKKTENDVAVKEDVLSLQKFWIAKKEKLHVFIPHNDIKELDLWLSESVYLVEAKKKEDALSKLEVVIELIEQIPKTYLFRLENVF